MTSINSPISELKGIGPSSVKLFNGLGVYTIKDLLLTLPYRYEDRSVVVPIGQLRAGDPCTIHGTVTSLGTRKSKRGVLMIIATIVDDSGKTSALWFNQRFVLRYLKEGQQYYLYGEKKILPSLGNPFIVKSIINQPERVAFYHSVSGLGQALWQRAIRSALPYLSELENIVPSDYLEKQDKVSLVQAAHSVSNHDSLIKASNHLGDEELICLALSILLAQQDAVRSAQKLAIQNDLLTKFVSQLPFQLTDGQRTIAWKIIKELSNGKVANHLLYGEVGSGKTCVAQIVTAAVVSAGRQVAYLCPTTALANQQFQNFQKLFEPLGIVVGLITGDYKDDQYNSADIVIGTHALLEKSIFLPRLELVIVDEQHRFGVEQRQLLTNDGQIHLLMMTATPIPRSLAQVLFGQLSISYLLDKPVHQQETKTYSFQDSKRTIVEKDICLRLEQDQPGYVICPLITGGSLVEENRLLDERKTIETEAKYLAKAFPGVVVGVLHGRLKANEKDKVLADFMAGRVKILLSTTVVEVGIDNPQASWILIEEADRFGVSQLHQLRGRVGRGKTASVCYLYDSQVSEYGAKRLQALEKNSNGLELAELDLSLRGPGELLGFQQSGLPNLRYANWSDLDRVKKAFTIAKQIIDEGLSSYPKLEKVIKNTIAKAPL